MALNGKTPAEQVGIEANGNNKWLGLLRDVVSSKADAKQVP